MKNTVENAKTAALAQAVETDALAYVVAVAGGFVVMTGADVLAADASEAIHGYADPGNNSIYHRRPAHYVTRAELAQDCSERVSGHTMRAAA